MQPVPVSLLHPVVRTRQRTALVASADRSFRQRLSETLTGLRWQVREAEGGAQAWSEVETTVPEALIVDSWLPDLDLTEFLSDFRDRFPQVDVVSAGGSTAHESQRGPYRQELLYALRRSQDTDTAVWNLAPTLPSQASAPASLRPGSWAAGLASGPASSSRAAVEAGGARRRRHVPGTEGRAHTQPIRIQSADGVCANRFQLRTQVRRPAAGAGGERRLHAGGQPPRAPGRFAHDPGVD